MAADAGVGNSISHHDAVNAGINGLSNVYVHDGIYALIAIFVLLFIVGLIIWVIVYTWKVWPQKLEERKASKAASTPADKDFNVEYFSNVIMNINKRLDDINKRLDDYGNESAALRATVDALGQAEVRCMGATNEAIVEINRAIGTLDGTISTVRDAVRNFSKSNK